MKQIRLTVVAITFFLLSAFGLYSHGFEGQTIVHVARDSAIPIKELCKQSLRRKKTVLSVDPISSCGKDRLITSVGKSISTCLIRINVEHEKQNDIFCSPLQEFYVIDIKQWVPAYKLNIGDRVWSRYNQQKTITSLLVLACPRKIYLLRVETTHTFFVGRHSLLTHNMLLPFVTIGVGASFGSGATVGGITGGCFGPLGITCGIVLGGLAGVAWKCFISERKVPRYRIDCNFDILLAEHNVEQEENKQKKDLPVRSNSEPKQQKPCRPKEHKPLTNKEARIQAKKWGYVETKEAKFDSKGKPKFIKDGRIITPDIDGHNGGVWKEFDRKNRRIATLDEKGERIKN